MAPLIITIPHQLSKVEARQRIENHLGELLGQYGSHLDHLDHHWNGDILDFQAGVMGLNITGKVHVEEQAVRVEVVLPWVLATMARTVTQSIEQEGQKLLSKPPPG
jgi:putative polyhydroxyalkanoate system protein